MGILSHLGEELPADPGRLICGRKLIRPGPMLECPHVLHQKQSLPLAKSPDQAGDVPIQHRLQGLLLIAILLYEPLPHARAHAGQISQFQTASFCQEYNISVLARRRVGKGRSLISQAE
jgi:hypothetical protein